MKWLDGYSEQTTDQLIAFDGDYRTDSIVAAFEEGLQMKESRVGKTRLTDEETVVLAIEAFERQVNNGGFSQFFWGSSEYAPVILGALNRIGCPEVGRLAKAAFEVLGIQNQISVAAVDRVMHEENEEREEKLNQLDEQYYSLALDLSPLVMDFIKSNRHKIVL
jgi:Domain of unknown function (DUF4375)